MIIHSDYYCTLGEVEQNVVQNQILKLQNFAKENPFLYKIRIVCFIFLRIILQKPNFIRRLTSRLTFTELKIKHSYFFLLWYQFWYQGAESLYFSFLNHTHLLIRYIVHFRVNSKSYKYCVYTWLVSFII